MTQEPEVNAAMSDWLMEGMSEETAAEINDLLLSLHENPVNINDTTAMASLPFITPFQHKALCYYIMLYGQLLSIKELAFVPGFDSATRALIEPLVKVEPYEESSRFRPWQGHHTLVTGMGGTVEQVMGYRNGQYFGDNMRALLCYTYNYQNKLNIRFSADKDPGEAWGRGNYYGYHLMLSDMGRLRRLIVGRYNLQFGQGLTIWTGIEPFNITGVSTMRFGTGIKPAGTFYEENYLEGVAATVDIAAGFNATAFASVVENKSLIGGRIQCRRTNLVAGATLAYMEVEDSVNMRDYVYNVHYFRGNHLVNAGADAVWQWGKLTLYGEASVSGDSGRVAIAAGAQMQADSRNRFGICYRRYDEGYHSLFAQGYSIGSTQNEQGIILDAVSQLPLRFNAALSLDIHKFPSLRYGVYAPSSGRWLRLRLDRHIGHSMDATIRYAYRWKERNVPNLDSALYVGENTVRQHMQAELKTAVGKMVFSARFVYCQFESENAIRQNGWAVTLAARYSVRRVQLNIGSALYDVDGYYARLYLGESNLQYVWSMPAFTGQGLRSYAVARYNVSERISLAAKYAITWLPGEDSIGSGDAMTEGDHRQAWHVQLRLKL